VAHQHVAVRIENGHRQRLVAEHLTRQALRMCAHRIERFELAREPARVARGQHDVEIVLRVHLPLEAHVHVRADERERGERGRGERERERRRQRSQARHASSFGSST
jgi:hypothetical protein